MTAASINSRRIEGLIMTIALSKSRILSIILPRRGNLSRSEKGGRFPTADWTEDQWRPEGSQEGRDPKPGPSEMMDDVEAYLTVQRSCYPERRLLPQQIVSSGPFRLLSLLYRPIGEFGEHPTNFFECGILADGACNCISMGRADKHTDFMAKAMCLSRPVPASGLFRITVGCAREG